MKEVHGRTLRENIADPHTSQHVSTERCFKASDQRLQRVCTAVGFAHGKGVIHRDLKPDNIMIAEFGQVFVLDWGLARVLQDPSIPRSSTPSTHRPWLYGSWLNHGTPAFMSPEQARRRRRRSARVPMFGQSVPPCLPFSMVSLHTPGPSTQCCSRSKRDHQSRLTGQTFHSNSSSSGKLVCRSM